MSDIAVDCPADLICGHAWTVEARCPSARVCGEDCPRCGAPHHVCTLDPGHEREHLCGACGTSTFDARRLDGVICSCGRPAVEIFQTVKFGSVGHCGTPNMPPLIQCTDGDCDHRAVNPTHDQTWCRQRRGVKP